MSKSVDKRAGGVRLGDEPHSAYVGSENGSEYAVGEAFQGSFEMGSDNRSE